ncbi:hypothetical protein L195_g032199 [Trifolium pratense]|uniref:Uncharacterized protein n=1 Tax=Trifolium pratense TaxID=57577 RepID=A0A2K3LCM7_TRIPR|nr:hypothetical protein L195_g032199 [Trifolium pratense]
MSKSTRSSIAKKNQGSSVPDSVPSPKITQVDPVSIVLPQEPKKMRTKYVVVRPKRIPIVSVISTSPELNKYSDNRRMKSTAGRNKGISKAQFNVVDEPDSVDGTDVGAKTLGEDKIEETLGKYTADTTDGVNTSVPHTGGITDNQGGSSNAKFWSDDDNDGVPDNETPKNVNVQEKVVLETPEVDVRSEKEKSLKNVMHSNASDTHTIVNSQSEESMKTVSENFDDAPTKKDTCANNNVNDLDDDRDPLPAI